MAPKKKSQKVSRDDAGGFSEGLDEEEQSRRRLNWEAIPQHLVDRLCDEIEVRLRKHLDQWKQYLEHRRGHKPPAALRTLLREAADEVVQDETLPAEDRELLNGYKDSIGDFRVFDRLLGWMAQRRMVALRPRVFQELGQDLKSNRFDQSQVQVQVLSNHAFSRGAAAEFLRKLCTIATYVTKHHRDDHVNVGFVSGSTVKNIIESLSEIEDWSSEFGIDLSVLPNVRVFALNVAFTTYESLDMNATILAYRFSEMLSRQVKFKKQAMPFGLTAPLIVKRSEREKHDQQPQTRDILKFTQPARVRQHEKVESEATEASTYKTRLDIVLTSVGEAPKEGDEGSMLAKMADVFEELFEVQIYDLAARKEITGDIVYAPVNYLGEPIPIETKGGEEVFFYAAIEPRVLREMSKDPIKCVMLAASYSPNKSKRSAIRAALHGTEPYASVLVIDEETAKELAE